MDFIKTTGIICCIMVFCIGMVNTNLFANDYSIQSPDKKIKVNISVEQDITYSVQYGEKEIIQPSPISMELEDGVILGKKSRAVKQEKSSVNEKILPVVAHKNSVVYDVYNQLTLSFKNNFKLVFRAYDDGVAWRFVTSIKGDIIVVNEKSTINFSEDNSIYYPTEEGFVSHFERIYEYIKLSDIPSNKMASLPALVDISDGPKVLITEADLQDYPGMFLIGNNTNSLQATFPAVPRVVKPGEQADRNEVIEERESYIAQTTGKRSFPWRVLVIAGQDADLVNSEMVFKLAQSCQIKDTSWIKPGKVAWDWWNYNNIYGVDFRAGINTETYRYYIDFASEYNLDYIILDEGWSKTTDVLHPVADIDIEELVRYGNEKNVGVILWVLWNPLDQQLDAALDLYEKWGIKGIKVDFMQRDDQWMVNYYHKIAREAAKHHLLVDFHGSYKPCGLRRTYPNALTREGLKGLENSKWSDLITPEHNVTIPFIRMVAGPMDFTPGAMINAQKDNFRDIFNRPMSMGTRCHQLAMYVVFESPLQMLCDNPSNYYREKECMEFLSPVPSVWDESKALQAKVGDYIVMARRHGDEWYVGAMTDWSERDFQIDLSFLGDGNYTAEIFKDGINADRYASDYKKSVQTVSKNKSLNIHLAPGGGWVARIHK